MTTAEDAPADDDREADALATDADPTDRPAWASLRPDLATTAAVALVGLALLVPLRALFRYQGPPMEEGFMLVFPELVLDGKVPHRDFLHLYGPGSLWALAAWYKAVGVTLTAERLFGLGQLAVIVFGMMALVRPWGRRVMAATGLFGVLVTTAAIGLTALAWDGAVALLVVGLWATLRGRRWLTAGERAGVGEDEAERRARRLFLLGGLATGLAVLFRPDIVVAAGAGALVAFSGIAWRRRTRWLGGAAAGVAPYLLLVATAGFGDTFRGLVLEPVFELRGGRTLPRPPSWGSFDGALQKVAALREPDWWLPALRSPQQAFVWFFLLPAGVAFILAVGWWAVRRDPASWRARVILAVGAVGLGMMPQALQRPDSTHLAWVSCVPLAFLPAAIAELLRHRTGWSAARRSGVAALALLAIPVVVIPHFTVRTYADLAEQSVRGDVFGWSLRNEGRTFYLGSPEIAEAGQAMLDDLRPQLGAGERLFVGTADLRKTPYSDAYLYFLLPDLEPATRYIEMDPGMANAADSGLADELASADWAILSHIWDGWSEPNDSRTFGSDQPNRVLDERFCPVGSYGPDGAPYFEVHRRCR